MGVSSSIYLTTDQGTDVLDVAATEDIKSREDQPKLGVGTVGRTRRRNEDGGRDDLERTLGPLLPRLDLLDASR